MLRNVQTTYWNATVAESWNMDNFDDYSYTELYFVFPCFDSATGMLPGDCDDCYTPYEYDKTGYQIELTQSGDDEPSGSYDLDKAGFGKYS